MRVFKVAHGDVRYPREWEAKLAKAANEAKESNLFFIKRDYSIGGYELLCTFEYDTEEPDDLEKSAFVKGYEKGYEAGYGVDAQPRKKSPAKKVSKK